MQTLLVLFFLSSCSVMLGGGAPPSAKGKEYKISFSEGGWDLLKKDDRSDYVFEHIDGRILLSNSFCGEFQEDDLDHLAKKTFKSVGNFTVTRDKWTMIENREAYRLEGKGKVDGVPVSLKVLNTRRNNCYFDFVSIEPKRTRTQDQELFDRFLKSVVFK